MGQNTNDHYDTLCIVDKLRYLISEGSDGLQRLGIYHNVVVHSSICFICAKPVHYISLAMCFASIYLPPSLNVCIYSSVHLSFSSIFSSDNVLFPFSWLCWLLSLFWLMDQKGNTGLKIICAVVRNPTANQFIFLLLHNILVEEAYQLIQLAMKLTKFKQTTALPTVSRMEFFFWKNQIRCWL